MHDGRLRRTRRRRGRGVTPEGLVYDDGALPLEPRL